jgi:ATP-dependent Zn protease
MTNTARERIAYHEAGHAVAAFTYHRRLHGLGIADAHDAGLDGYVKRTRGVGPAIEAANSARSVGLVTEDVTIMLAGVVTERQFAKAPRNHAGVGSDYDRAVASARQIVSDGELAPYMKWVTISTHELVTRRWPAVEALAQQLLAQNEVSGAAARARIRGALHPSVSDEEIARAVRQFASTATR